MDWNVNEPISQAAARRWMVQFAFIKPFGRCLSCSSTKATVNAFIISHWESYASVWSRPSSPALHPLSVSYNRTARLILQCDYKTHHGELCSKLNWFPPFTKPEYYHAQIVYKCRNNMHPAYLNHGFWKDSYLFIPSIPGLQLMTPATLWKQTRSMVNALSFLHTKLQFSKAFCPLLKAL